MRLYKPVTALIYFGPLALGSVAALSLYYSMAMAVAITSVAMCLLTVVVALVTYMRRTALRPYRHLESELALRVEHAIRVGDAPMAELYTSEYEYLLYQHKSGLLTRGELENKLDALYSNRRPVARTVA